MSSRERFPPVLALGTSRVCLAIARSLAAHGVAVDVATSGRDAVDFSRAVRAVHRLPSFHGAPEYFLERLLALLDSERYELIFPASDTALAAISRFHEPLTERTKLACPRPGILDRVLRKDETLRLADECGVPVPRTWSLEEARAAGRRELVFPLIAKPGEKHSEGFFKTRRIESHEELERAIANDEGFDGETLLQAYAPGEGVGVEALFHNGEPLVLFQHRRLKEFPFAGGVSVVAVSEAVDPELADHSVRLLRAMEWEGAAMVEFRHDRASGSTALMEVNGRLWGSLPLSMAAGVNFPYYCWQLTRGERPTPVADYRVGLRARWAAGDLQRVGEIFARSRRDASFRGIRRRELGRFVADFGSGTRDMVWSFADPGPALFELAATLLALAQGVLKSVARNVFPEWICEDLRTTRDLGGATGWLYLRARLGTLLRRRREPDPLPGRVRSMLFVCHGNIIRSALAEAIVRRELSPGTVCVGSAGVGAQSGREADERACTVARDLGVALDGHRARAVTAELIEKTDVVFVMDELNAAYLLARYPRARRKMRFLGEWNGAGGLRVIADPYRGSLSDVQECGRRIQACAAGLARAVKDL